MLRKLEMHAGETQKKSLGSPRRRWLWIKKGHSEFSLLGCRRVEFVAAFGTVGVEHFLAVTLDLVLIN